MAPTWRQARRDAVTLERVLKAMAPADSRFKNCEGCRVRELYLPAEVMRYWRERWLTPSGETMVAPLPAGIVGGFGPELRRFILASHTQGQVTAERLTAFAAGGMEALWAGVGVATTRWITVETSRSGMPARTASSPSSSTIASPPSRLARRNHARRSLICCGGLQRLRR